VATPGSGHVAWTVSTPSDREFMQADPVGVGDGILVGLRGCVGFVEASGRLRWGVPGILSDAVRVGDTVVIAVAGQTDDVMGVDATTGRVDWSERLRGGWHDVVAQGRTVMLVGTGFDGSVVTLDAATGRRIDSDVPTIPRDGNFRMALAVDGLLVTAGIDEHRGAVVIADASGRIVKSADAGLFAPDPVALVGDVLVLQSSGITTGTGGDGEPSTHLVGLDRRTLAERWRRVLPGQSAGHGVEVAGVVVVRHEKALSGVDARSGAVLWSVPGPDDWDAPLVAAGADVFAVGWPDGRVAVHGITDGQVRWSARVEGQVAVLGWIEGDVLLAANDPDFYRAYRVSDGTLLWAERSLPAGAGASRGGLRARMTFAGETAAAMSGLRHVVALRRVPSP